MTSKIKNEIKKSNRKKTDSDKNINGFKVFECDNSISIENVKIEENDNPKKI